jgi:hypothetical protein
MRQILIGQAYEEEETLTSFEFNQEIPTTELPLSNGSYNQTQKDARLVGWEFKIVRAKTDLFRDPAVFQKLCEEEKLAGWMLLEKLDDRRIRFKRPTALRDLMLAEGLTYDPYRTHYGPTWTPLNWLSAIAAILAFTVPTYLGYTYVSQVLAHSQDHLQQPPAPPPQKMTFPARPIRP